MVKPFVHRDGAVFGVVERRRYQGVFFPNMTLVFGAFQLIQSFSKDKKLLGSLALAFAGIGIYTAREFASPEVRSTLVFRLSPALLRTYLL